MKTNTAFNVNKSIPLWVLLGFTLLAVSHNDAFAICCFPYDMTHYIDPQTGNLVVNGELWNDSYKAEPFGNSTYEFLFHNSTGGIVFQKELTVTNGHPLQNGFVIHPGINPLPFQIVIDDVDPNLLKQVEHVSTGRTSVQYFEWKPPDLSLHLQDFAIVETITSKTQDNKFDKWQITGIITNTNSETTQNAYVVASIYNADHNIVGVAGYSTEDTQPITLDGHQTKTFKIHALVPQKKSVQTVSLYAESDDSSAKYDKTKPIILRPANIPIKHGIEKNPIAISANVTNITRDNVDLDWIIQIKKSPKSLANHDITKYPNSTVAFVKMIPASIHAQESKILEYSWVPESGGIYFYEMFLWDKYKPVSSWFEGSFLYSDQILVSTNSLKEQLAKVTSLDQLQCRNDLILAHRASNSNFVCVKPESAPKLIERGWAKDDSASKTNVNCMTIEQSKQVARFFKTPTYLPEDYSFVCSRSGIPFESYIVYYNQEFPNNWQIPELVSDGAIFIHQTDERNMVGDKKFETYGSPEQRIQETYDSVMEENPSLNPQLVTINGMLAYAVDSCDDCGMQTADFANGTTIQKSTSTETRIKFIDENGVSYMLETTLPLSELIKVAESLQ